MRSIETYLNGEPIPGNPIKVDFTNDDYLNVFHSFFPCTKKLYGDEGFNIKHKEFKNGLCIFGFELSPSHCSSMTHQEILKTDTLRSLL